MVEVKENLRKAVEKDKTNSRLESLSKITCLSIDEVG